MATNKPTSPTKPVEVTPTTTSKTATPAATPNAIIKAAVAKTTAKPKASAPTTKKTAPVKPVVIKTKVTTVKKIEKEKPAKLKMERDSFTMPKAEYAQFYVLKDSLVKAGHPVKKSELLRAGLMLLSALSADDLKATMAKIPAIKTGRPKK